MSIIFGHFGVPEVQEDGSDVHESQWSELLLADRNGQYSLVDELVSIL